MKRLTFLLLLSFLFETITAQQNDGNNKVFPKAPAKDSIPIPKPIHDRSKKTKLLPSMIVPAVLIGYGLTTFKNNGLYSSYQAKKDIQNAFGNKRSHIDDYLVISPYIEFGALLLLKQKCKNDMLNTFLLIGKSEAIMFAIVLPLKYTTHMVRPDGSDPYSFPSGHTAEAFVAATIVYREYRYKSPWYGIGAYTLAATVGAYRMINNKHWESDVLVGAGIGILSANLVYATHLYRWGRKDVCIAPIYDGKNKGLAMSIKF